MKAPAIERADGDVADRLRPRGIATRAKLVAVAERLFAERGVDGVPLSEINKAAGQRNANACQYHFGDKDGLLQAILDKHVPGIAARRHALLDEMEAAGPLSPGDVVRAFVRPVAEKLYDPDGGKEFIRINAQLVVQHTLFVRKLGGSTLAVKPVDRLNRVLAAAMATQALPDAVVQQRLMLVSVLLFHGLADHLRLIEQARAAPGPAADTPLFIADLESAMLATLTAPLSAAAAARLAELERQAGTAH
jgi:AcrR family transcriptional regulator